MNKLISRKLNRTFDNTVKTFTAPGDVDAIEVAVELPGEDAGSGEVKTFSGGFGSVHDKCDRV